MAARLATVGDEFGHGADPGHPANGSQPFAVAGAILRQIAKQIRFHTPKMMVLSKPGNSGNFLKGNGSVAVLISAAAEQCPLLSESGQIVAVPRNDAKCQKRTHAPQQTASLFDHLVGADERPKS
jgi:hypothetical protein